MIRVTEYPTNICTCLEQSIYFVIIEAIIIQIFCEFWLK